MPMLQKPLRIPLITSLAVTLVTLVLYALLAGSATQGVYFDVWYARLMYLAWLLPPIAALTLGRGVKAQPLTETPHPVLRVVGALASLASLALGVHLILLALPALSLPKPQMGIFALLGGVLAVLGAPAPALLATQRRFFLAGALTGMALPLSVICYVMSLYFDTALPKNASHKLILSLALCLLVLYLLCEAGELLGRYRPRWGALLALSVTPLLAGAGVGGVILSVRLPKGEALSPVPAIFCVIFFLYIYMRVLLRPAVPSEDPISCEASEEIPHA